MPCLASCERIGLFVAEQLYEQQSLMGISETITGAIFQNFAACHLP